MSVLIDIEMPETCGECAIHPNDGCCDYCPILEESTTGLYAERLPKCPLREVPEEIGIPIFDKETGEQAVEARNKRMETHEERTETHEEREEVAR